MSDTNEGITEGNGQTQGLILAAGRGSRLNSLTEDKPKGLVEVAGKPIVHYVRTAMAEANVQSIYTVTGYQKEQYAHYGKTIENPNWATSNMVSSLLCARHLWQEHDVVVSYSDIIFDADIVRKLVAAPFDIAIAYSTQWRALWEERFADPLTDAESFRISLGGKITQIGQRCQSMDDIQGQYMGLFKLTPRGGRLVESYLKQLDQKTIDRLDMTSLLSQLCENKIAIHGVENSAPWFEIDSVSDIPICEKRMELDYV